MSVAVGAKNQVFAAFLISLVNGNSAECLLYQYWPNDQFGCGKPASFSRCAVSKVTMFFMSPGHFFVGGCGDEFKNFSHEISGAVDAEIAEAEGFVGV